MIGFIPQYSNLSSVTRNGPLDGYIYALSGQIHIQIQTLYLNNQPTTNYFRTLNATDVYVTRKSKHRAIYFYPRHKHPMIQTDSHRQQVCIHPQAVHRLVRLESVLLFLLRSSLCRSGLDWSIRFLSRPPCPHEPIFATGEDRLTLIDNDRISEVYKSQIQQ